MGPLRRNNLEPFFPRRGAFSFHKAKSRFTLRKTNRKALFF
ncbi:MAG TPA: hypothetical protein VJ652_03420 [Noviherbaspirillum sp.]|nr:hypothetical protein [Noviherbaspirillum sp.]